MTRRRRLLLLIMGLVLIMFHLFTLRLESTTETDHVQNDRVMVKNPHHVRPLQKEEQQQLPLLDPEREAVGSAQTTIGDVERPSSTATPIIFQSSIEEQSQQATPSHREAQQIAPKVSGPEAERSRASESPAPTLPPPEGLSINPLARKSETETRNSTSHGVILTFGDLEVGASPPGLSDGELVQQFLRSSSEGYPFQEGGHRPPECSDNSRCDLGKGCFATEEGICYKPPFHTSPFDFYIPRLGGSKTTFPRGGTTTDDLVCSWQPEEPSKLPRIDFIRTEEGVAARKEEPAHTTPSSLKANGAAATKHRPSPQEVVDAFKFFTGAFHQNWYDWDAPIVKIGEDQKNRTKKMQQELRQESKTATKGRGYHDDEEEETHHSLFQMSGEHDNNTLVYKLRNFCLRASGRIAGFNVSGGISSGRLQEFQGANEMVPILSLPSYFLSVHPFVSGFIRERVEDLLEPPSWYVDRKLLIQPFFSGGFPALSDHAGHILVRTGAAVSNLDDGFPRPRNDEPEDERDDARRDVTTVYLNLHSPEFSYDVAKASISLRSQAFAPYTTLTTTTHFSIFDTDANGFQEFRLRTQAGRDMSETNYQRLVSLLQDHPVCFKEAVFAQNCHLTRDCLPEPFAKPKRDHSRNSYPLIGFKQPRTQRKIAKRLRACAAVQHLERRHPDPEALTLFYSYRGSNFKSLLDKPTISAKLFEALRLVSPRGRILQGEMKTMSVPQMAAAYSVADIIFAPYGSSALMGIMCPPGSAGVEVNRIMSGMILPAGHVTGVSRTPTSDFGSQWQAAEGFHMTITLQPFVNRPPQERWSLPLDVLSPTLKGYSCLLKEFLSRRRKEEEGSTTISATERTTVVDNGTVQSAKSIEETCQKDLLTQSTVHEAEMKMLNDTEGMYLRRAIRNSLPDSLVQSAPRLLRIHNQATKIAPALSHLRKGNTQRSGLHALLVIFSCETPDEVIEVEVSVWRRYLGREAHLFMMFDRLCPDAMAKYFTLIKLQNYYQARHGAHHGGDVVTEGSTTAVTDAPVLKLHPTLPNVNVTDIGPIERAIFCARWNWKRLIDSVIVDAESLNPEKSELKSWLALDCHSLSAPPTVSLPSETHPTKKSPRPDHHQQQQQLTTDKIFRFDVEDEDGAEYNSALSPQPSSVRNQSEQEREVEAFDDSRQSTTSGSSSPTVPLCRYIEYDVGTGAPIAARPSATALLNRSLHHTSSRPSGILRNSSFYRFNGTCSFKRRVVCPSQQEDFGGETTVRSQRSLLSKKTRRHTQERATQRGTKSRRKGKALVLMMINNNPYELKSPGGSKAPPDWTNLEMFFRLGYIPSGQPTELFDAVDFVVFRAPPVESPDAPLAENVTLCGEEGNVKFLFVPRVPCELCAYGRVLKYLGYEPQQNKMKKKIISSSWVYRSVVFLNSEVRGPFQHGDSSAWIDSVSMAGESTRPMFIEDEVGGDYYFMEEEEEERRGKERIDTSFSEKEKEWNIGVGRRQRYPRPGGHGIGFYTVGGSKFVLESNLPGILLPLHFSSEAFMVVPILALPYYFELFLDKGCSNGLVPSTLRERTAREGFPHLGDVKGKAACALRASIRTIDRYLLNRRGRLTTSAEHSGVTEHNVKDDKIRVFSFADRQHVSATSSIFQSRASLEKFWKQIIEDRSLGASNKSLPPAPLKEEEVYIDPCATVFVHFGGEELQRAIRNKKTGEEKKGKKKGNAFHSAVQALTRWQLLSSAKSSVSEELMDRLLHGKREDRPRNGGTGDGQTVGGGVESCGLYSFEAEVSV